MSLLRLALESPDYSCILDISIEEVNNFTNVKEITKLKNKVADSVNNEYIFQSSENEVKDLITRCNLDNNKFFIAKIEDNLVGICACFYRLEESAFYIGILAIDPDHQGKGIGSSLIKHCKEHAQKLDCQYLTLSVDDTNKKAYEIYLKNGFRTKETVKYHNLEMRI